MSVHMAVALPRRLWPWAHDAADDRCFAVSRPIGCAPENGLSGDCQTPPAVLRGGQPPGRWSRAGRGWEAGMWWIWEVDSRGGGQ